LTRKRTIVSFAITLSGLLLAASVFFFLNAGSWLLLHDKPPERLDVIFTFSENPLRDIYSRELARQHPSAIRIICAADWRLKGTTKDAYFQKFVDGPEDSARTIYNDSLQSTFIETLFLKKCLLDIIAKNNHQLSSQTDSVINVGLVSNIFHLRRIHLLTKRLTHLKNVNYFCLAVPDSMEWVHYGAYKRWWKSPETTKCVLREWPRIAAIGLF